MKPIMNRYEFVYLFDVVNGNPNGDPDAGNLPRLDPETNHGLVTDVCLKRKIRNYVSLEKANNDGGAEPGYSIYMQEKAVLNNQHKQAYAALEIEPEPNKLPKDEVQARELTAWMCKNFYDIRAFGAVMTTGTNCGQVRGPVQLAFASSIDPIVPLEISITRMAVTTEKEADRQSGDNRTMGRKHLVPYGLYRAHGFVSAKLAEKTRFSEEDLELLWRALENMFEHDRSAARGEMAARRLVLFKHKNPIGDAPAHRLFDCIKVERQEGEADTPARCFGDYRVIVNRDPVPSGVDLIERL